MPLISQNSLQWKTLNIVSNTNPWDPNRIGSGLVMAKMSSKYLFKSPGSLLYKINAGVRPQFSQKEKGLRVVSKTLRGKNNNNNNNNNIKRGSFHKFQTKCVLLQIWMEISDLWKVSYFLTNLLFLFNQKIKIIGVIVWQICNFWSKYMGSWWVTEQTFDGVFGRWVSRKRGFYIAYLRIWECPRGLHHITLLILLNIY